MSILGEFIRSDKPLSTGAMAVYPYSVGLERKYRFRSRFGDLVEMCHREGDYIHLPRALCPIGMDDVRVEGQRVEFPKCPEPREHQVKVFEETASFLKRGQSGIVSAYTAFGKTALGYYAAHVVGRKTLVITTKDDIYKQWIADAPKFLGIDPSEVGEIRGDVCEVKGTKFVVAMIHSISKEGRYPAWIADDFGLVIWDEIQRLPAEKFSITAGLFPAKLRLGLTATLERSDGKELLIQAHVGPVRAKTEGEMMIPKVIRFTTSWKCPRRLQKDKNTGESRLVYLPHEAGKTTHLEKIIAGDGVRNTQIVNAVISAHQKGRKIVVFSTLLDHLKILRDASVSMGIPANAVGMYVGANTKSDRMERDSIKARPVLFATFSMMGEGTNLPWLDTCVLAMPRSKVTQPVGRIRREYEGKKEPVVMDFVDTDSPVFAGYAASRKRWYRSIGCKIVDM